MKKFTLNREFLVRHLGVTLLMAGLGCWFVFDGAVTYPKMDAVEFCEKHHKSLENPEREKAEAIKRQYQFASIAFIAALAIGMVRFRFDFWPQYFTGAIASFHQVAHNIL